LLKVIVLRPSFRARTAEFPICGAGFSILLFGLGSIVGVGLVDADSLFGGVIVGDAAVTTPPALGVDFGDICGLGPFHASNTLVLFLKTITPIARATAINTNTAVA
jgi:hypothetical protein